MLRFIIAAVLVILAAALFVRDRLEATTVLVAATDLEAGHPLASTDVREVEAPRTVVPPAALPSISSVDGQILASAMGTGEILTSSRVEIPAESESGDMRTVSVPVPDRGTLALLRPGAVVDIFSASPTAFSQPDLPLAAGAKVKEVPRDSRGESAGTVAIQVPTAIAPTLAAAAIEGPVSIVLVE